LRTIVLLEGVMAGEMVTFPSNGGTASGYLAAPANGTGPGVVVIQEWWGLVPHIKGVADRFAAEGFVALAPDLYHGKATKSPDEAGKLMMAMNIDQAERDLGGSVAFLASHPGNATGKVGTVGFCMGGALSLYAASKNPAVGAAVVFYGGHPKVQPDLPSLEAPVLGLYAENDGFVTVSAVRDLERKLKGLAKEHEIHIYPGADHGFFNDERPEVYNSQAAADAWRRTLEFFKRHLA
jgi:carboxymethylenebutenolidase